MVDSIEVSQDNRRGEILFAYEPNNTERYTIYYLYCYSTLDIRFLADDQYQERV